MKLQCWLKDYLNWKKWIKSTGQKQIKTKQKPDCSGDTNWH